MKVYKKNKRESGIESLRLLAMFLIMLNHFPWIAQHNFAGCFANSLLSMWGGRWRLRVLHD